MDILKYCFNVRKKCNDSNDSNDNNDFITVKAIDFYQYLWSLIILVPLYKNKQLPHFAYCKIN